MSDKPIPRDEVGAQLERMSGSAVFSAAPRTLRFLRYIVALALDGKGEQIKELSVGIDVFDRPESFDPKLDSIVRVEAGKLRKRLAEYYETDGRKDSIRIEVPKGGYVPEFQERDDAAVVVEPVRTGKSRWALAGAVAVMALIGFVWLRPRIWAAEPAIAVLPFVNMSGDPANAYFADGLSEELTDALTRVRGLHVVARTSAFFFRDHQEDVRAIGQKLGATTIVEGSVRREGDRVKVTAQVVSAVSGYHLWSQTFDREAKDIFRVQQEIALAVVEALRVAMPGATKNPSTNNLEAYDLYLRAKAMHGLFRQEKEFLRAEEYLQQAVTIDPRYARAYLLLADLYGKASITGYRSPEELVTKGRAALRRALEIDGDLADGHALLGTIAARYDFDWKAAETHLRRAIALDPDSAFARNELAQNVCTPQGRFEEALRENALARKLEPLSRIYDSGYVFLLSRARRHQEAVAEAKKLLASDPARGDVRLSLSLALLALGKHHEAIAEFRDLQQKIPGTTTKAFLSYALALGGQREEAARLAAELEELSRTQYVPPTALGLVYAGLGELDKAFAWIAKARLGHESALVFVKVGVEFDPLRADPRFAELVRSVGL